MIDYTLIGKDFGGVVLYLNTGRRDQPSDKQAEILGSSGVSTNSPAETIADFNLGRALNPKLGYAVWHTSLSFNPDDAAQLDSAKMLAIAEGYLKKMGLDNTQYVIVRHHDKDDNQHLHIIANRVDNDGNTIDDGRNFHRSKQARKELIAEFGLTPIKGQRPELQHPERFRGIDLARHELLTTINQVLTTETQRPHLLATLQAAGIGVQERFDKEGKPTGISFEKDGYSFKGSALGRHLSSAGIDKQLAANELKQQAIITVSEPTINSLPLASIALGSGLTLASAEKAGSVKLSEVPAGQLTTAEQDRLAERAVAAVAAFQRKKDLLVTYQEQANRADKEGDLTRFAELKFEKIPAAQERMVAYEVEAKSTPLGIELLGKQKELDAAKVQKSEMRVLDEQPVVSAVLASQASALSTQQPVLIQVVSEALPAATAPLESTPVTPYQAGATQVAEVSSVAPEPRQGLILETGTTLPTSKGDDYLLESTPPTVFEQETKGVVLDPQLPAATSQQLPAQQVAQRQVEQEVAKEALAGIRKEQALIEVTKREAELAEGRGDYGKVAELRYGVIPESEQRLADYRMQAEATPAGRELLAEQDQAQKKAAEQAHSAKQEQQKAEEVRVAEQQAAQAAVDGVRRERVLLEASRREAVQAEQQGETSKVKSLRGDIIPQTERRLTDYQVQAEATEFGRTLLAKLNEQEKAQQRAVEVLSQLAAKQGFVSHEEFGQKAVEAGYILPPKLYGQPQQVVEKSSGLQFAVPLIDGQPLEKIVDKAIRMEENARLHQKTEMRKLEIACADYTRYSGKEVVRVRVAADQVTALQKHVGSGAIADKEAGSDGRIGISIIYNPSGGALMVSEVVAQVKKSGGEVFEQPEQAARRARSTQAFTSSIAISLGKEQDREMGS